MRQFVQLTEESMANRDETKRKKRRSKKTNLTPFIIIGVLAVVVVAVVILGQIQPVGVVVDPTFHTATVTDGLTMGDPNAPVKVVEFADFQCPACGSYWSSLEPSIIEQYVETGKVFYTYSPFSFLGDRSTNKWDESKKTAEAAYCANDQGKFWQFRDYVYANQSGENQGAFSRARLLAFAEKLALDMTTFEECLDSGQYAQAVADANAFAEEVGVTFTPSFTVNGELMDANALITAIDAAAAQ